MTTLSERITLALQRKGMIQSDLAARCGIAPASVNDWLSGKTKTMKAATALAAAAILGVRPQWLSSGAGPMLESSEAGEPSREASSPGVDRMPIRRVLFKLSAGVSGYEVEFEDGESEPIFMAQRWFKENHLRPEKLLAVKVSGRSMEPTLYDGDLIIIDTDNVKLEDGAAVAANFEGDLVIKRLKRSGGQWFLASDNADKIHYGDKLCGDGCGVIGRVIYKQSEHI